MATPAPPPTEAKSDDVKRNFDDDKDWPLWTDQFKDKPVEYKIRAIRQTEYDLLQADDANITSASIARHSLRRIYTETYRYLGFVYETWMGLALIIAVGGVAPFDLFTMFVYAGGGTAVLGLMLPLCLLAGSEPIVGQFSKFSGYFGGGNSLVNASNANLFKSMTKEQFKAGVDFLSGDIKTDHKGYKDLYPRSKLNYDPRAKRVFSLDAAKLFVQFSAIVYEFKNEPLRDRLLKLDETAPKRPSKVKAAAMVEAQSGPRPSLWDHFKATVVYWNIPILSTVLYDPIAYAKYVPPSADDEDDGVPNDGEVEDSKDDEAKAADTIYKFCNHYGLWYQTLSHLGDTSSAVSGLFWAEGGNWVTVVFKGTSPVEYGEWISNLNTKLTPIGSHVNGFKRVHKGFKERVFPEDSSRYKLPYGSSPYDTITLGIKTVAKELRKHPNNILPNGKPREINVWFTGHSLGCSTATLVYSQLLNSKAVQGKEGKKPLLALRDAYLFAAPIVCDGESVDIFNSKMFEHGSRPRTMWRVTNSQDFVATCLPELGDFRDLSVSVNNAFALAHLGTEIKLQDAPLKSLVAGNHLQYGTSVEIKSAFSPTELVAQFEESLKKKSTQTQYNPNTDELEPYDKPDKEQRDMAEVNRLWWGHALQQIPFFLGRLFAHGTVNYVDQLNRVALGECEWIDNFN